MKKSNGYLDNRNWKEAQLDIINWNDGIYFEREIWQNTYINFTNITEKRIQVKLENKGTFNLNFDSTILWENGTFPILSNYSTSIYEFFYYDNNIYGRLVLNV